MPTAPPLNVIRQPAEGIYGRATGDGAGLMVALTAEQIREIAGITPRRSQRLRSLHRSDGGFGFGGVWVIGFHWYVQWWCKHRSKFLNRDLFGNLQ